MSNRRRQEPTPARFPLATDSPRCARRVRTRPSQFVAATTPQISNRRRPGLHLRGPTCPLPSSRRTPCDDEISHPPVVLAALSRRKNRTRSHRIRHGQRCCRQTSLRSRTCQKSHHRHNSAIPNTSRNSQSCRHNIPIATTCSFDHRRSRCSRWNWNQDPPSLFRPLQYSMPASSASLWSKRHRSSLPYRHLSRSRPAPQWRCQDCAVRIANRPSSRKPSCPPRSCPSPAMRHGLSAWRTSLTPQTTTDLCRTAFLPGSFPCSLNNQ